MRKADIVNMVFGSHLYGLNTENSDMDYKGLFLPTTNELLLNNYPKTCKYSSGDGQSKNTNEDVDMEVVALPYFISQACKGETYTIDMLHCTKPELGSYGHTWEDLVSNRTKFYSKDMKAYVGYVKRQASKYGLKGSRLSCIKHAMKCLESFDNEVLLGDIKEKLYYGEYVKWLSQENSHIRGEQEFYEVNSKKYQSTNSVEYVLAQLTKMWDSYGERAKLAEKNEGLDFKAISHALRAGFQARDIYKDGDFEYPLKETDFILSVKKGELDYKTEVSPILEGLVEEVEILANNSSLPKKVDTKFWDNWLLRVYFYR
jgi:hypothetical protein